MHEPVVVTLEDLKHCKFLRCPTEKRHLIQVPASVPFETLEEAFGPSSLGILIVKDLPSQFPRLRHELLSYASYLANLPTGELGMCLCLCLNCSIPDSRKQQHLPAYLFQTLFPALQQSILADGVTAKRPSKMVRMTH